LGQVVIGDIGIALHKVLEELAIDKLAIDRVVVIRADNGGRGWGR
jgi:hypothetical protein